MPPVLLDGRELADRIGYPVRTVMAWYRDEKIPGIRTGRKVYFDLGRVIEALRRAHAGAEAAMP